MEVMAAFFPIGIKCCIAIGNQIIKLSCTIRPNGMRADDVYDTAVILKGRLKHAFRRPFCRETSRVGDIGVSRVVVDAFEIFAFHREGFYPVVAAQGDGHVAHHVFDEFRVFIGAFGDVFFVGTFQ